MNTFYPSQLLLFIFNTHGPMKDSTTDKFSWNVNIRKHVLWPEKKSKNYYKNSTWFKSNSAFGLDLIHLSLLTPIVLLHVHYLKILTTSKIQKISGKKCNSYFQIYWNASVIVYITINSGKEKYVWRKRYLGIVLKDL